MHNFLRKKSAMTRKEKIIIVMATLNSLNVLQGPVTISINLLDGVTAFYTLRKKLSLKTSTIRGASAWDWGWGWEGEREGVRRPLKKICGK